MTPFDVLQAWVEGLVAQCTYHPYADLTEVWETDGEALAVNAKVVGEWRGDEPHIDVTAHRASWVRDVWREDWPKYSLTNQDLGELTSPDHRGADEFAHVVDETLFGEYDPKAGF